MLLVYQASGVKVFCEWFQHDKQDCSHFIYLGMMKSYVGSIRVWASCSKEFTYFCGSLEAANLFYMQIWEITQNVKPHSSTSWSIWRTPVPTGTSFKVSGAVLCTGIFPYGLYCRIGPLTKYLIGKRAMSCFYFSCLLYLEILLWCYNPNILILSGLCNIRH